MEDKDRTCLRPGFDFGARFLPATKDQDRTCVRCIQPGVFAFAVFDEQGKSAFVAGGAADKLLQLPDDGM